MSPATTRSPLTPVLLTLFFLFGTAMTAFAGASLAIPHGPLARIWRAKPDVYEQLLALGPLVAMGFFALSALMALTVFGVWRRRRWGWMLAVGIFIVNALADAARAIADREWNGLVAVAVVALILWWLLRRDVRAIFT